jgi:hypothetical protein
MNFDDYSACIEACSKSAVASLHCARKDLEELDVNMLTHCIRLDHDCADISILAIKAMASGSEFIKQICLLCAEICNACAAECEKHTGMDHCKKCAETCRKTAVECTKISRI